MIEIEKIFIDNLKLYLSAMAQYKKGTDEWDIAELNYRLTRRYMIENHYSIPEEVQKEYMDKVVSFE